MIPLSTDVSLASANPLSPYGPGKVKLAVVEVVAPASRASLQPSPSLSVSNLFGMPSPSVSISPQLEVIIKSIGYQKILPVLVLATVGYPTSILVESEAAVKFRVELDVAFKFIVVMVAPVVALTALRIGVMPSFTKNEPENKPKVKL